MGAVEQALLANMQADGSGLEKTGRDLATKAAAPPSQPVMPGKVSKGKVRRCHKRKRRFKSEGLRVKLKFLNGQNLGLIFETS